MYVDFYPFLFWAGWGAFTSHSAFPPSNWRTTMRSPFERKARSHQSREAWSEKQGLTPPSLLILKSLRIDCWIIWHLWWFVCFESDSWWDQLPEIQAFASDRTYFETSYHQTGWNMLKATNDAMLLHWNQMLQQTPKAKHLSLNVMSMNKIWFYISKSKHLNISQPEPKLHPKVGGPTESMSSVTRTSSVESEYFRCRMGGLAWESFFFFPGGFLGGSGVFYMFYGDGALWSYVLLCFDVFCSEVTFIRWFSDGFGVAWWCQQLVLLTWLRSAWTGRDSDFMIEFLVYLSLFVHIFICSHM